MAINAARRSGPRIRQPLTAGEIAARRARVAAICPAAPPAERGLPTQAAALDHHGEPEGAAIPPQSSRSPDRRGDPGGEPGGEPGGDPGTDPSDRWIPTRDGLRRWRPIVDRVEVRALSGGGAVFEGGGGRLLLDPEMRAHVAWLLLPDEWREILVAAGVRPPGGEG